jgi:cytoskeletal protein RodZ
MNDDRDEQAKSKLWKNYIIIMGVMIGGSILILIGQAAWTSIQNSLNDQNSSPSQPTVGANQSPITNPSSSLVASPNSEKQTPDTAIINHYRLIDNKELDKSWNNLSPSFKGSNLTQGFKEYIEWWNSVEKVYIGDVQTLKISDTNAVVKAELSYKLRSGRVVSDKKKYIYLVWTDDKWLIDGKSEMYNN